MRNTAREKYYNRHDERKELLRFLIIARVPSLDELSSAAKQMNAASPERLSNILFTASEYMLMLFAHRPT
mgnify:CR=1 FL=1